MKEYEVVIGLEVHAELATKTKIFCGCTTEFGGEENTHCCPVCTGMPGALPVLNEKVVEYAVKAGMAMNCNIARTSKNDRKNYFYPDLPKAYQISQFDMPLCEHGYLEIETSEGSKKIGITRIHIEEDAGKLNHDEYGGGSLVDLNRACVPLIEIVSEPDIRSSEEAKLYVEKIKSILEYLEVSDCKMQEGSLRADVNLSIREKGQKEFGTRTEMKNLNSFKAIVRAIEFEQKRQIEVLENGGTITQDTLRWDDIMGETITMRTKENAQDYRYFPDPDLLMVKLSEEYIENIKNNLPELSESRMKRYVSEYNLPEYDSKIITSSRKMADFFEEATKECNNPKAVSNWIMTDIQRILNEEELEINQLSFTAKDLAHLIKLIDEGTISSSIAKKVFAKMLETGESPETIVEKEGLKQISDTGFIEEVVNKVLENNPQSVEDYKAGKDKALGYLVGQAMKETKGKANPAMLNQMLKQKLSN